MHPPRVWRYAAVAVTGFLLVLAFGVPLATAATPSHPLSHIFPTDTNLNMSNNPNAIGYNITNLPWLNPFGTTLNLGGDLDVRGNDIDSPANINNFFQASQCSGDQVVKKINPDGTYVCDTVSSDPNDVWVDENGDSMTGDLNMQGNDILNVQNLVLGWTNLTDHPGCGTGEAIQRLGDTLECTNLSEGGDVNGTGERGQVSFFLDNESVGGDDELYWDSAQLRLGIHTQSPSSALDVNASSTFRGTLNMQDNDITNVNSIDADSIDAGKLNVSNQSNIAAFTDTGITFYQPLSIESGGPLSVANGIELTDSTSNTIDSYGTFYLSTSSGSPSDIVLDPTGEIGVRSTLDMAGNNITNIGALQNFFSQICSGSDVVQKIFNNGTIVCTDPAQAGTENLSETLKAGNSAGQYNINMNNNSIRNVWTLSVGNALSDGNISNTITIDSGGLVDTGALQGTVTNDVNAFVSVSDPLSDGNISDSISINDQGTVNSSAIEDRIAGSNLNYVSGVLNVDSTNLDADTLDGQDGAYYIQNLSEVLVQGAVANTSINMSGNNITDIRELQDYFGSACPDDHAVAEIFDNGTLRCIDTVVDETTEAGLPGTLAINNTANQSINMNGYNLVMNDGYLSNDGDDEGVRVDNQGRVGVGADSPQSQLEVDGSTNLSSGGTSMEMQDDGDVVITLGS